MFNIRCNILSWKMEAEKRYPITIDLFTLVLVGGFFILYQDQEEFQLPEISTMNCAVLYIHISRIVSTLVLVLCVCLLVYRKTEINENVGHSCTSAWMRFYLWRKITEWVHIVLQHRLIAQLYYPCVLKQIFLSFSFRYPVKVLMPARTTSVTIC